MDGVRKGIDDAYLKRVVSRQLARMQERLEDAGTRAPAVVIKSNGWVRIPVILNG